MPNHYHQAVKPHLGFKEPISFKVGQPCVVVEGGQEHSEIKNYNLISIEGQDYYFEEGHFVAESEGSALLVGDQTSVIVVGNDPGAQFLDTFLKVKSFEHQGREGTIGFLKNEVGLLTRKRNFFLHGVMIELEPFDYPMFKTNKTLVRTDKIVLPIYRRPEGFKPGNAEAYLIYRYPDAEIVYEEDPFFIIKQDQKFYLEEIDFKDPKPLEDHPRAMTHREALLELLLRLDPDNDQPVEPLKRLLRIT